MPRRGTEAASALASENQILDAVFEYVEVSTSSMTFKDVVVKLIEARPDGREMRGAQDA